MIGEPLSDELLEITEKQKMSREDAAARLRAVADQISRHNQVQFVKNGMTFTAKIPAEVDLKVEVEIGEESEIEIELTW
jgi:amphi-Trp domain-containing protein